MALVDTDWVYDGAVCSLILITKAAVSQIIGHCRVLTISCRAKCDTVSDVFFDGAITYLSHGQLIMISVVLAQSQRHASCIPNPGSLSITVDGETDNILQNTIVVVIRSSCHYG